jgi:hypothetical protein
MFGQKLFQQKLDAFGVQDCGLTGDSCGQPLFSHKPAYWYQSTARMSRHIKVRPPLDPPSPPTPRTHR